MRHGCERRPLSARACDEHGIALIIALMAMSLLMALGLALVLTTTTEGRIAGNYRQGTEALYAADAAIERVIQDTLIVPDWDALLGGAVRSGFIDGPPGGVRTLPGGSTLDLSEATNLVRCGKTRCSDADLIAVTSDRPWARNNPVWQLYAYGRLDQMVPDRTINSDIYVAVWVADDPSENDDDPLRDGAPPAGCDPVKDPTCADGNMGRGVIAMMAQAYGPDGVRRTIEVTLVQDPDGAARQAGVRILSWREVR
jgi:hypothetical protein